MPQMQDKVVSQKLASMASRAAGSAASVTASVRNSVVFGAARWVSPLSVSRLARAVGPTATWGEEASRVYTLSLIHI